VLLRSKVTTGEHQDQRVTALKLAEPANRVGVVGKFVVGEDAAGDNIGTHALHLVDEDVSGRNGDTSLRRTPTSWADLEVDGEVQACTVARSRVVTLVREVRAPVCASVRFSCAQRLKAISAAGIVRAAFGLELGSSCAVNGR